jgi:hypothetical protein
MGIKDMFALRPVKKDERLEGIERILDANEEIIASVTGTGQGKVAGMHIAKYPLRNNLIQF